MQYIYLFFLLNTIWSPDYEDFYKIFFDKNFVFTYSYLRAKDLDDDFI